MTMSNLVKSRNKISLIGAGNIGGQLANLIAIKNLGDIVLLDVALGVAKGKALDLEQSGVVEGFDAKIKGTNDYSDIVNSDVIIVTAGIARKPGMSRDDLLSTNSGIIKTIAEAIKKYSPNAFVIVVTNPLDVMVALMQKFSGLPTSKVVGMAGVLDSSRMSLFIANELNVSIKDVNSCVLGGHGDTMVPLIRYSTVGGVPIPDLIKSGKITQQQVESIIQRTRDGGAEIVKLLGNGSAFYAPASSAIAMAESYINNRKRILPVATFLSGHYGVHGMYIGVPAVIGGGGVEKIIELELNPQEKSEFDKSVIAVKDLLSLIEKV